MADRELERRANHRLAVLRHVEEVSGNVAATCRYYGISRQCYYGWLRRYEADGLDGLKDRSSRARVGGLLQLPPPSRRSQRPNALRAPPPESPRPAVIGVVSSAGLIRWGMCRSFGWLCRAWTPGGFGPRSCRCVVSP